MPYKDPDKQRDAVKKASRKYRKKQKILKSQIRMLADQFPDFPENPTPEHIEQFRKNYVDSLNRALAILGKDKTHFFDRTAKLRER